MTKDAAIVLLKKLEALAQKTEGSERNNALERIAELKVKYGITDEDLKEAEPQQPFRGLEDLANLGLSEDDLIELLNSILGLSTTKSKLIVRMGKLITAAYFGRKF